MSNEKFHLLGDLGGTHLRLALSQGRGPEHVDVYKVAEWPGIAEALDDYAKKNTLKGATFFLSHTGHMRDGALKLDYKKNPWFFKLADLREKFAFDAIHPLNDLKAAAYAPLYKDRELFACFRAGEGVDGSDAVVIGIGTGVGHAYLSPQTKMVRETYGGHFPIATVNDAQAQIIDLLRKTWDPTRIIMFEDIVTGDGLFRIYQALAELRGVRLEAVSVAELFPLKDKDPLVKDAASLFSEFMGLHAHIVCSVPFAYGGVYLCGGVMDRLIQAGLFDERRFITQFHQKMVNVVDHSLRATPLYVGKNEHIALYGLEVFAREQRSSS